jgi:hypothetical protein
MPPAHSEPDRSPLPCRPEESRAAAPAWQPPPAARPAAVADREAFLLASLAGAEPVAEALACLSPAEEKRLSCLLRKLRRHLENLLAGADNGPDAGPRRRLPRAARVEERS